MSVQKVHEDHSIYWPNSGCGCAECSAERMAAAIYRDSGKRERAPSNNSRSEVEAHGVRQSN